jgi:drug/metabolite transporter (DMT)-like permease
VALGALALAGEVLSPAGTAAIVLVCLGIWVVAGRGPTSRRPALLALGTGTMIAAYTVCDGLGARASGDVLAYIVWLFLLDGWPFAVFVMLKRGTAGLRRRPWPGPGSPRSAAAACRSSPTAWSSGR